jgi:hypothetical protein
MRDLRQVNARPLLQQHDTEAIKYDIEEEEKKIHKLYAEIERFEK